MQIHAITTKKKMIKQLHEKNDKIRTEMLLEIWKCSIVAARIFDLNNKASIPGNKIVTVNNSSF